MTPKCKWDADAVLQRYEHDINNSAIGNEYETIGIKYNGARKGGIVNLDIPKGRIKERGLQPMIGKLNKGGVQGP